MKALLKNWLLPNNKLCFLFKNKMSFTLILFLILINVNVGQIANYVSNGGFEVLNANAGPYSFDVTKYWGALDTTKGSNALFSKLATIANSPNSSFGFQYPRNGNNFVAVQFYCNTCANNPRGYPRNRLKQPLQAGKIYCAKYHIVNTNNSPLGIDSYGMYFGDNTLDTISKCTHPITYLNPQVENTTGIITDTLNWIAITGTFVANGTEKYMVLGNFKSNANTSTLLINPTYSASMVNDTYIDDVSVIDIDLPAYAGPDIWGLPTTTVYLGRPQDVGIDEACKWYKLPNTTTAIDTAAGITITVAATTQTYTVKQDICGIIKYDTVVVYASGVGLSELEYVSNNISIFPNPATDILNIEFNLENKEMFSKIRILNNLGQLIREEELKNNSITIKDLPNGVYLLNFYGDKVGSVNKRFVVAR